MIAPSAVTAIATATAAAAAVMGEEGSYENALNGAFEIGGDGELLEPERLLSDWIEIILLSLLLGLGLPLNSLALIRLLQSLNVGRKGSRRHEIARTSFLWLKIHLIVIDLLVILAYCPSHIAWLVSYTWSAGDFLCKAMQYSWDFSFHLMSFGVVSIAVDRLRTVYTLMEMHGRRHSLCPLPSDQLRFVRRLIACCYIGALLFSLPQWFVWTTVDMRTWSQCTTIWHKKRALQFLKEREFDESFHGERLYTLVHLFSVFWIPFAVLFFAYLYIVIYLFYYSLRPYSVRTTLEVPDGPHGRAGSIALDGNASASDSFSPRIWQNCTPAITPPPASKGSIVSGTVPAWRVEMRSRMFRTTVHVIAAYLACFLPYNVLALATFFSHQLQLMISTHLDVLRVCVLLNTLFNPFINGVYAFGKRGQT